MNFKYLKLFEEFEEGKFSMDDIDACRKEGRGIYATVIKDFPNNKSDEKLDVVDCDFDTGEITVRYDNNIYYVDLKNVERVER